MNQTDAFKIISEAVDLLSKAAMPNIHFMCLSETGYAYEVEIVDDEVDWYFNAKVMRDYNDIKDVPQEILNDKVLTVHIPKTYLTAPNCPEIDKKYNIPENESLDYKALARCGVIVRQD